MHDNQNQTHWAYVAGVMDSDGCFMLTKHNRKMNRKDYPHNVGKWSAVYLASVKICQVEPEAIYFIHNELGYGTVTLNGVRPSRPNSRPIYQWGMRKRSDMIPFLENVIPYLKIKKERAKFLLKYCKNAAFLGSSRGPGYFGLDKDELVYREESYQQMRKFNGKKVGAETKPHGHESASDSPTLI